MLSFILQYKAEPQDISVLLQEKNLSKVLNENNKKQNKQTNKQKQLKNSALKPIGFLKRNVLNFTGKGKEIQMRVEQGN